MMAFPFIATFVVMFVAAVCIEGLSIFTRDYWAGYRAGPEIVFTIYGFIFAACFLPALGVVAFYRWRSKRNEDDKA
jgi:branched-subunit amino acid permease